MITMATWEESLQTSRHITSHAESPVALATPTLPYTTMTTWAVCGAAAAYVSICNCVSTYALPLGSLVEAGAPSTKRTLLMPVVEWQQGVGAQPLEREAKTKRFSGRHVRVCLSSICMWPSPKITEESLLNCSVTSLQDVFCLTCCAWTDFQSTTWYLGKHVWSSVVLSIHNRLSFLFVFSLCLLFNKVLWDF